MKRFTVVSSMLALLAGCQTASIQPDPSILRVGVSPDSQPMVFKQNGQIMGIEADFAQKLGKELNRKVVFVDLPWDKQIDYLEQNKTDIIMSNMSITAARGMRINFTSPYLQSGLSALFRRDNFEPSGLIASTIRNQTKRIGYVENRTGGFFCMERFTRADLKPFKTVEAGIAALNENRIDMFVHDAPVIWWASAVNEKQLVAFPELLNVEPLAWGIGKHNMALLDEVNALLATWEKDGTAKKIIQNWIPNFGM
jgi:polar amino acid transport system substrate-binding protein